MDTLAAGVVTAVATTMTEITKARAAWWESLSPEKRTQLADKYADGELRWIAFWERLWSFVEKKDS
jgi:hypothetical protein